MFILKEAEPIGKYAVQYLIKQGGFTSTYRVEADGVPYFVKLFDPALVPPKLMREEGVTEIVLGRKIRHTPEYSIEIHYNEKTSLDQVLRYCKDSRMAIVNLKIHALEGKDTLYAAEVRVRGAVQPEPLTEHIGAMRGIVSAAAL